MTVSNITIKTTTAKCRISSLPQVGTLTPKEENLETLAEDGAGVMSDGSWFFMSKWASDLRGSRSPSF